MSPLPPAPDDDELAAALRASRQMVDAPEALIRRAIDGFDLARPRARADAAASRGLLPRLLAVLQFDSGQASPLAFGRRSGGAEVRQLLYTLPACDVDLRVAPADGDEGRYSLSGQLLGPDSAGVIVAAASLGGAAQSAVLNELGEFRLPPLAPGAWRLSLELADKTIELPPLELGPRP
jgi:hypothetical protein